MARTWLKVEGVLPDHPKVLALAAIYGVEPYLVVGFLVRWWAYCTEFASAGRPQDVPRDVLNAFALPVMRCATIKANTSIAEALKRCGLMDKDGAPHDWEDFGGAILARRALETERKKRSRGTRRGHPTAVRRDIRVTSGARVEQSIYTLPTDTTDTSYPSYPTVAAAPFDESNNPLSLIMPIVRTELYRRPVPRAAPDGTWSENRDASIAKRLLKHASAEEIVTACQGLRALCEAKLLGDLAAPGDHFTLRALYSTDKSQADDLFYLARDYALKHVGTSNDKQDEEGLP